MKTLLGLNFALICFQLFCANYSTVVPSLAQVQTFSEGCTKDLMVGSQDTLSEAELIKRLKKTVNCLKYYTSEEKSRQDDDDDEDFQLPTYVPQIIKIVGSVLSGNVSSTLDNSLALIPGGGDGALGSSITGLISTLANTITESRPRIPTRPPRRKPTRGPTRKPPMRNRTRRTTTSKPILNQQTNLNFTNSSTKNLTTGSSTQNSIPSSDANKVPINGAPIIFVLPNIPIGISVPSLTNNPNLLQQVVNQSLNALLQPVKNNPNSNPQINQNFIQQRPINNYPNQNPVINPNPITQQQPINNYPNQNPQINPNLINYPVNNYLNYPQINPNPILQFPPGNNQPVNGLPATQGALILQQNPNIQNADVPVSVSTTGNFTVITAERPSLNQEQLLSNLLNILTKLGQNPTIAPPVPPAQPQATLWPTLSPTLATAIIPTTTEDEYYYYEDDETTTAVSANGTAVIKATTVATDDDDDDGSAAAVSAVIIKAGEANGNKTQSNSNYNPFVKIPTQTALPEIVVTKGPVKIAATTLKAVDKDIDEYDEYDEVATTTKVVIASAPTIKAVQSQILKVTAKVPTVENDEEEAEAQAYLQTTPKTKFKITVKETEPGPVLSVRTTTEENEEEDYDEKEKSTKRTFIYSKPTKTVHVPDEGEDEAARAKAAI